MESNESKGKINYINFDDKLINDITNVLYLIIKKKDISYISDLKNNIYKAIISGINTGTIICKSVLNIIQYCGENKIKDNIKFTIISNAATFQSKMTNHCKDIIHLEAFYYSVIDILTD